MESKRLVSIDVLRTIALVFMVQTHFVENMTSDAAPWTWLYSESVWGFGGIVSAPLFLFLSGLSLWLWFNKQQTSGKADHEIRSMALRRGLGIFVFGFVFLATIWFPRNIFAWDILTTIGFSLIIMAFMKKLPPWVFIACALIIAAVSPPIREATDYASHWDGGDYVRSFTLHDIALGFVSHGYFGIFPWLVFPFTGFALGKICFPSANQNKLRNPLLGIAGLGLLCAGIISYALGNEALHGYTGAVTFYPASTSYILIYLGMCISALWALHVVLDGKQTSKKNILFSFAKTFSTYSLTIYYVHHAAHLWPLYIAGKINHDDVWYYYANTMTPPLAIGLAVIFVVLFYAVLRAWENRGGKFSLGWILRRLMRQKTNA